MARFVFDPGPQPTQAGFIARSHVIASRSSQEELANDAERRVRQDKRFREALFTTLCVLLLNKHHEALLKIPDGPDIQRPCADRRLPSQPSSKDAWRRLQDLGECV